MTSLDAPRYAWVLAGRYLPPVAGQDRGPRAEFEAFASTYGAELISASALDGPLPLTAAWFKRIGLPQFSLAQLVLIRTHGFDAIIASGEDIGIPLALATLFRGSRMPIHMMFHGHHLESRKLRLLAPLLRSMKHVHFHCLSRALKERTQSMLGIAPSRCHATGYGVDTAYFAETAASDANIICSAGAANRDYQTLAAAVQDLPVAVKIAADSAWVRPSATLKNAEWPANVDIRSYENYDNLRALYAQSRFVVVPLHPATHACGYAVIAEAMAMGRSVIATRTQSPPDFLIDGVTGILTTVHDMAELRLQISDLLKHPEKANALGRRARAWIMEHNSLENYCTKLETIIQKESGRFFKKKIRKKLLQPLHGMFKTPPAENSQKFFAALFFKKARSFFPRLPKRHQPTTSRRV